MQNTVKGYRWLYIGESEVARSTHSSLSAINLPGRQLFLTIQEAQDAFNKASEQFSPEEKSRYKIIEVF